MSSRPRISSVYNRAHGPAPTGAEAKARNHDACAEMWHKHRLAVIDPAEVRDDWTRQAIENEANRLYGKRG